MAFANHPGGATLVLGVDDDGKPHGMAAADVSTIMGTLANLGRDAVEPALALDHAAVDFQGVTLLPVLGVHAFELAPKAPAAKAGPVLTCKGKGVQATGYEASQGFVVRAGSQAVAETVPSMEQHVRGMFDLRQELISVGVLVGDIGRYQFIQDYTFSAPSTAAAVVLGRSANGRVEWKAADGRTLKALQEAEAAR